MLKMMLLYAVVVAATFVPSLSRADKADVIRSLYQNGQRSYNLRRFDDALEYFKSAYDSTQDPVYLFNIAQCQRMLGRRDEAIFSFRAYLRSLPDAAPERETVEHIIAKVEAQPAAPSSAPPPSTPTASAIEQAPVWGKLVFTSDPTGAEVHCTGESGLVVGITPFESTTEPGSYRCRLTKNGYTTHDESPIVEAGKTATTLATLSVSPEVASKYQLSKVDIRLAGTHYEFVDGNGHTVTENEFLRRFRSETRSDELATREGIRTAALISISSVVLAAGVVFTIWGAYEETTCSSRQLFYASMGTDARFASFGDCIAGNLSDPSTRDRATEYQVGTIALLVGPPLAVLGAVGLAIGILRRDGSAREHRLTLDEARRYSTQYNSTLFSNLKERSRISSRPTFAPVVGLTGVGVRGAF